MRAAFFIPVFAAAVFAQDSSSSIDEHPQTTFLQQTNSLGVVTGQPSVVTSQPTNPAVVTSQDAAATSVGLPASIPAVGSGITTIVIGGPSSAPNATQTLVVSANNSTTIILSSPTSSGASGSDATGTGATGSGASGSAGSQTGSGSPESTGAAATMKAVAGSVVGVGAFMAAFL
jgi:hypothetical protein